MMESRNALGAGSADSATGHGLRRSVVFEHLLIAAVLGALVSTVLQAGFLEIIIVGVVVALLYKGFRTMVPRSLGRLRA
jgi:hypothetical protein